MSKITNAIEQKKEVENKQIKLKERAMSGSTLMDIVHGGKKNTMGFEFGTIVNIVGDKGSSKTFLATEIVATNLKKYKNRLKYNYDDKENGNTIDTVSLFGFDINKNKNLLSKTVEELYTNILKFVKSLKDDDLGIYIIDSLDSLTSQATLDRGEERVKAAENDKDYKQGTYNLEKQAFLAQEFFPQITTAIEDSNCLLIIVSQTREKIGITFGSNIYRTGGKGLDFYCSYITWLSEIEKLEVATHGERRVIGTRVKVRNKKIRAPRPFRECYYTLLFDYGLDDLQSNIDYLFNCLTDLGKDKTKAELKIQWKIETPDLQTLQALSDNYIVKKNNKRIEAKDVTDLENIEVFQLFSNKKIFIEFIEKNNLENDIRQMVIDKWESIEDSIKTVRKSKI